MYGILTLESYVYCFFFNVFVNPGILFLFAHSSFIAFSVTIFFLLLFSTLFHFNIGGIILLFRGCSVLDSFLSFRFSVYFFSNIMLEAGESGKGDGWLDGRDERPSGDIFWDSDSTIAAGTFWLGMGTGSRLELMHARSLFSFNQKKAEFEDQSFIGRNIKH